MRIGGASRRGLGEREEVRDVELDFEVRFFWVVVVVGFGRIHWEVCISMLEMKGV